MLPVTGERRATPNMTTAQPGPSGRLTDAAPPCAMPARRPGADRDRIRADRAAAGEGQPARPPAASLQRVLDALRQLG